jgi:hypothetical protein
MFTHTLIKEMRERLIMNTKTPQAEASKNDSLELLCMQMIREQQCSRRWANLFRAIGTTFFVVFLIAIYSNQLEKNGIISTASEGCINQYVIKQQT